MPRPQTDREATVERLLEAAEDMIRQRGAISITITDIAAACGMSQSNVYRFFASKEALWEAIAERWFRELGEAMDGVVVSDASPREKMTRFFQQRLAIKRGRFEADPALYRTYIALGDEHRDVVQGYLDLADHNLSIIIGEAMAEGHFSDRSIDEMVQFINLLMSGVCNPILIAESPHLATADNVDRIVAMLFAEPAAARTSQATLRLAS